MRPSSVERNGYQETIGQGMTWVNGFGRKIVGGKGTRDENMQRLKEELSSADAIVIGAGAGLSASAGFTYSGERFRKYFGDFAARFGIRDMYSGGFYPFPDTETFWAWWSRHIYYNRYVPAPRPVYEQLLELVRGKDYFVITTNVDHQFQRSGFDKARLFYTQGDYGLFQQARPTLRKTWDNQEAVEAMLEAQGFIRDGAGIFRIPDGGTVLTRIPAELIPKCPEDGSAVTVNLRSDDTFVEDEGWHRASAAYSDFLREHEEQHILFLELGVGLNTPVIIKYPFWQMTAHNSKAVYACLNFDYAVCPREIEDRAICVQGDIGELLADIM